MPNTYRWIFFSLLFLFIQQQLLARQGDEKPVRFVMVGLSHGHSH